eukprot:54410-Amphidinium_carterae.1
MQKLALRSLQVTLGQLGPRFVQLDCKPRHPFVLYTDAAWETHLQRVGAVLTFRGKVHAATWADVPVQFLNSLKPRQTQITPCEAAAVVAATDWFAESLRDRDLIVFVDNTAAAAALASGSSRTWDLA